MRIGLGAGAAAMALALSGVSQAAEAPLATVLIKPSKVVDAKAPVEVTMTIPNVSAPAGEPFVSAGLFTPGLSRPAELISLSVSDAAGPVPLTIQPAQNGLRRWVAGRAISGQAVLKYSLLAENIPALSGGPPTALRVDGPGVSGVGQALMITPEVKGDYRIALKWDVSAMGPCVEGVSSWGDGDVMVPAGPLGQLTRGVYMAGPLQRETHGAFSAVWITGEPSFDPRPSMKWTADLHKFMSGYFKDKSEPPYRVFMRFNPMNAGGGAALTHSFLVTYGKGVTGESFKAILGHEMTHTWTAAEAVGKWYSEGNAVFYQAMIPWKAGLFTTDQYLQDINETAYRYFTNALRDAPDSEIVPRFWEDTRIRVLPYDRGAMYFAVLNGKIRRASDGKRRVDDLILVMMQRAKDRQPVTEEVWVDLVRKELGEEGVAVHKSMMAGGLMLPESGDFGSCFRRATTKMRQFDLGFDNASIVSNPKVIKGLKPGSEAEKAGLRNGDVLTYGVALDSVQGDIDRLFEVQVTRDGKTFPLSYKPRGAEVETYVWERVPGVSDAACKS